MRCAGAVGRAIAPRRFSFRQKSGPGSTSWPAPHPAEQRAASHPAKQRAAAIAKLRRKGDWQGALSILFGGPQDLVLFTSAANVCAKASTWRTAVALLEKLQITSQPDVIFWSSLGDAYSSVGKWQHALWALLQEPQAARLDLTAVSYASALTACERVSLWEKVLHLLETAEARNLVNAFSYSSAIVACGSAKRWQCALELWEAMTNRGPAPNVVAMNATLTALQRGRRWFLALQLLDAVDAAGTVAGDAVTAAALATAESWEWGLLYLLRATEKGMRLGPSAFSSVARQMGHQGAWQQAKKLLALLRKYPATVKFEVWCSVLWAMDVSGVPLPLDGLGTSIYRACGRKELALLDFVYRHVPRGDLPRLLSEVRRFAAEREWLKVAGGSKARLLEAILRPGDRVLELGCFVGYSALLMALRLRRLGGGGKVLTCEVNAVSALVARQLVAWAKAPEVEVKVGLATDWLQQMDQLGVPDVVVLDHRGARYHEDLSTLEAQLRTNSRILADNVLSPGAPLFLNFVDGRYAIAIHEVDEFLRERKDWVVACMPRHLEYKVKPVPVEFTALALEIDRLCWRSSGAARQVPPQEWLDLQERLSPLLYCWAAERLDTLRQLAIQAVSPRWSPSAASPSSPSRVFVHSPVTRISNFGPKARSTSPPRQRATVPLTTFSTFTAPQSGACGACRAVSVPMIAPKQAPSLIRVAAAATAMTGRQAAAKTAYPLQQLDDVRHRVQAEFWSGTM